MTTRAQIDSGYINLHGLESIAKDIVAIGNKHGMRAVWRGKNRSITVKVIQQGRIIFSQTFTERYWHLNIAVMYGVLHDFFTKVDAEWAFKQQQLRREQQEREEEARIAAMPSWGERIKNQNADK